jgi:2-keto-4-pentenoate hydratase/2-oxohepta-3-ene-1,7-dioic acid hydratase in catechol pathway
MVKPGTLCREEKMRLAMIAVQETARPAVQLGAGGFADLSALGGWRDLEELITEGGPALARIRAALAGGSLVPAAGARPVQPLCRPEKIMCIGKNYADHCRELGLPPPARPVLFAKFANALAGPDEAIPLPTVSRMIDWEAELAVVVGRTCRNAGETEALECVFGYCAANDLTMRDVQEEDGQWVRAKSPDKFCPLGPVVVTRDEVADPQALGIRLTVNGRLMQDSNTREMVFGVGRLLSFLSQSMTLRPGDILLTGTPPGVGAGGLRRCSCGTATG